METYEKQTNRCYLCLLLFYNNVDLKKKIKETVENLFQFDFGKP